ncbi:low molecular weight protein arginine phosphatase [Cytobacillus sp. IB215665]|uniref:low molecular weight protein arginine phosphatase n=1 Tax=Cytobacillus sp. IB215665 TaxID=3097357 RepID=UPI002A113588|nr:low molecular weight protein arginine phosphatase [Cytobacillus sp. IB215665]MDX8363682.1 low molecular weight protein arginine phosphatase [Cytobacillus sp. IB215665]
MTKILFVCTGNTCRSPMAEALLKHKNMGNIQVRSAGIYANNGSTASANANEVLGEKDIVLDHNSSQLEKEHIDWSTYILTMTSNHKHLIVNAFPEALYKTYTLKEFVEGEGGDISDPFGGSVQTYRQTMLELERLIEKLYKKLI